MASVKVTDSIYSVGILNPNMRVFDIVMETEYGTSYNAYILKGSEKTVLIETCHKRYFKHFIENVSEVADVSKIDYIVLNHNEPDHSGALAQLMDYAPNATIVVSQAGALYLKNITNRTDLKVQVVKHGDSIDIGGKTMQFINAPFLHWPDSMFTWVPEEKTLFSCDFLGTHYCEPYMFDYNMAYERKYEAALKNYYDAIFAPFKPYVLAGLEKIRDLDIERACTSHGPILTKGNYLSYAMEKYAEWSQPHKNAAALIPVFYTTAYGNTGLLADALRKGILEAKPDAQCETYDIIEHDMAKLGELINKSDAFAIGSPTINGDAVPPTWILLAHVEAVNNRKKPALVFGSYGWSGEAVPAVTARLQGLRMNVFGEGLKTCFVPTDADLQEAQALGKAFAESLS